jgi:predicted CDP-diglyceride synthetase/phosphatidate cytidylyltransferase
MVKKHIIIGTVLGFVGGILFSIVYFGEMQLTTPMAYIHEVSGALLGCLIGWISGLSKAAKEGKD